MLCQGILLASAQDPELRLPLASQVSRGTERSLPSLHLSLDSQMLDSQSLEPIQPAGAAPQLLPQQRSGGPQPTSAGEQNAAPTAYASLLAGSEGAGEQVPAAHVRAAGPAAAALPPADGAIGSTEAGSDDDEEGALNAAAGAAVSGGDESSEDGDEEEDVLSDDGASSSSSSDSDSESDEGEVGEEGTPNGSAQVRSYRSLGQLPVPAAHSAG